VELRAGTLARVMITKAYEYDLEGRVIPPLFRMLAS